MGQPSGQWLLTHQPGPQERRLIDGIRADLAGLTIAFLLFLFAVINLVWQIGNDRSIYAPLLALILIGAWLLVAGYRYGRDRARLASFRERMIEFYLHRSDS